MDPRQPEYHKKTLEIARELVLERGDVISIEEFHRRLEENYDVEVIEHEDGSYQYRDTQDIAKSAFEERIPLGLCQRAVMTETDPEEIMGTPEEEAEAYRKFADAVDDEFERQLEEEDEPFPLEYPPNDNKD